MDPEFVVLRRESSKRRKRHSLLKKENLLTRSVYHNNITIMKEKSPYQRDELKYISDKGDSFYINYYVVKMSCISTYKFLLKKELYRFFSLYIIFERVYIKGWNCV